MMRAVALRAGLGQVTAEVVAGATRLTRLSHTGKVRLHPAQTALTDRAGAAGFTIGRSGGRLVSGDQQKLKLLIGPGATALGRTHGATKVYKATSDDGSSEESIDASIASGGLLVLAPDPVMPFARARHTQSQRFELETDASVVVVNSVSCDRPGRSDQQDFYSFSSSSEFGSSSAPPFLTDIIKLDAAERGHTNWSMDIGGVKRAGDNFASVVAVGPRAKEVASEMNRLAVAMAVRSGAPVSGEARLAAARALGGCRRLPILTGSVCIGVSRGVPDGRLDVAVARIVAEHPSDLIRILSACMKPLASELGMSPYADRILADSPLLAPHVDWLNGDSPAVPAMDLRDEMLDAQRQMLAQLTESTRPVDEVSRTDMSIGLAQFVSGCHSPAQGRKLNI